MTSLLRFGRYSLVALLAAGSDWLVFSVMVSLLGLGHLASLMTARVVGGVASFLSNRHWTWGAHRQIALTQQGRRFLLLYGFSYVTSVAFFSLLSEGLALPPYPSKLATDIACFALNFVVMNGYVFNPRGGLGALARRPLAGVMRRLFAERP